MKTKTPAHSFFFLRHTMSRRTAVHAFTLVEMVTVVAVVTMMFSVAAPYTMGVLRSASLTSAGDTLMQKISQAQQRATTENRPVGLDFFYYNKDEIKGCHAIQLISYNPANNQTTALEPAVYWSEGRSVLVEGAISPMFSTNVMATSTGPATQEPFKGLDATYKRVLFYPNGSTSLRVPLRLAYVTLISIQNYQKDMEDPPPNYYTVQIDPVTGRGHSYRP